MTTRWFLVFAALVALPVGAAEMPGDIWLELIAQTISCPAKLVRVESAVVGNNGMRSEYWVVSSCKGEQKYAVEYWRRAYFPNKDNEYTVRALTN